MFKNLTDEKKQFARQIFLSMVTIVYIIVNGFWLTPKSELRSRITDPFKDFWLFWGLHQSWALFSPTIKDINYHVIAIVTYENGYKRIWEPPRMDKLDLVTKFQKEKFRKWTIDSLPWPEHKKFWPDIARYIGRELYTKENPPKELSLCLLWSKIPHPVDNKPLKPLPDHTRFNTVFTYKYVSEDFQ